VTSITFAFRDN